MSDFNYLAFYIGGEGEDTWEKEAVISGVDMLDAAKQAQGIAEEAGGWVVALTQEDYDDPISVRHLHAEYMQWVLETFPGETVDRQFEHLKEEFKEYCDAPEDPGEAADVLMLFFSVVRGHGIDIFRAFKDKFKLNKARKWKLTERGWRHDG